MYQVKRPYLLRSLYLSEPILALRWTHGNVSNIAHSKHFHDIAFRKWWSYNVETVTPMSIEHFYTLVMDLVFL